MNTQRRAILDALLAAVFYAVSMPFSKILLQYTDPTIMAGLLYLGAGIGIFITASLLRHAPQEKLSRKDLPFTVGMIVLDIAAPLCLLAGLLRTAAANASLLNNFEIVATSIIALLLFHEAISRRLWAAILLVTFSSALLSLEGTDSLHFSAGSLLILLAAVCWGFENNCTRMLSAKDTFQIVTLKGLFSGGGALLIGFTLGERLPAAPLCLAALLLGFVSYGLSIWFYVRAQYHIGAARTSAFYAAAPFVGALLSFILLREPLSAHYFLALLIMAAGTALIVSDAK